MGAYIFITEQDRVSKRKVSDEIVNEEFQEALKHDHSLMIEEHKYIIKKWLFGREINKTTYSIYHETPAFDGSPCQARFQSSGSGEKHVVIAYLHGIINGSVHREMNVVKPEQKYSKRTKNSYYEFKYKRNRSAGTSAE